MPVGEDQRPWSHKELIPQEIGASLSGRFRESKEKKGCPSCYMWSLKLTCRLSHPNFFNSPRRYMLKKKCLSCLFFFLFSLLFFLFLSSKRKESAGCSDNG